jgi:hypothetical protein
MSGLFDEWTWLKPVAAIAGAIAAGAGAGVGTAYIHEPPVRPGLSAAHDPALAKSVAELQSWREAHDRDISKRWEDAGDKMAGNRGEIERLRNEVTETNRRLDRVIDRERSRANGGGSALVDPIR